MLNDIDGNLDTTKTRKYTGKRVELREMGGFEQTNIGKVNARTTHVVHTQTLIGIR